MATHSRILAWEIPWTEEPGGQQSMGSQRVGHNLETNGWKQVMRKEGKDNIIHACTLLEPPSQSCFIECVLSYFSHVRLFVILWTVAHQATLSMGLSRQESWSGLPCPPSGDLPYPGIEPTSLLCWQAGSLPAEPPGKPRRGSLGTSFPFALSCVDLQAC